MIIHWKPRGQGGRKKTDHRWPFVDQLIYYLLVKGPIRPDHHMGPESVRCDIGRAHDELRQETDTRYCGGVVAEQSYRQVHQQEF